MNFSVKICGLTNFEDAVVAAEAGANQLGFVLEPTSPRFVTQVDALLAQVRLELPQVERVAVYGPLVQPFPEEAQALQGYGDSDLTIPARLRLIQTLRAESGGIPNIAREATSIVVDAFSHSQHGGTGKRVSAQFIRQVQQMTSLPIILAGGLTPDNVGEAITQFEPAGVDVSSGVESAPGKKDWAKVRDFVAVARYAARGLRSQS